MLTGQFLYIAFLAFISVSIGAPPTAKARVLTLTEALEPSTDLRPYTEAFSDRSAGMDLRQVLQQGPTQPREFVPLQAHDSDSAHASPAGNVWLRLSFANDDQTVQRLVLQVGPAAPRDVSFYLRRNGAWHDRYADTQLSRGPDMYGDRYAAIPLTLHRHERLGVLVRVRNAEPGTLRPILYAHDVLGTEILSGTLWDGVLAGGVAALAWCAFLIGVIGRSRLLLWLAAAMGATALYEAATHNYIELLGGTPIARGAMRLNPALDMLAVALYAGLAASIVAHSQLPIGGRRAYLAIGAVTLGLSGLTLAVGQPIMEWTTFAMGAALAVCLLFSSVRLLRRSRRTAGVLLLVALMVMLDDALKPALSAAIGLLTPAGSLAASATPCLILLVLAANLAILVLWSRPGQRARGRGPLARVRTRARTRLFAQLDHSPDAAPDAMQQARERERQKTEVLAYVGHDLRAPLATIAGYTRLLRPSAATAPQQGYLDAIEASVGHQFSLIDEIMSYTKSELKPFLITPEQTHLPSLLQELARFGIALCSHHDNVFEYLPAPTLPSMIWIDPKRARQAVLNLLGNAAKYTRNGTVRFEACVQQSADATELVLHVQNDGPPIVGPAKARIFSAFKQLRQRQAGMGLGLFIVERVAHGMGGQITLESGPELGSRFSLRLPVRIADATPVAAMAIRHVPRRDSDGHGAHVPPLSARLALARLARDGEITEIGKWLQEHREMRPAFEPFYADVAACLDTLDLERLQRMALQQVS